MIDFQVIKDRVVAVYESHKTEMLIAVAVGVVVGAVLF